MMAIVIVDVEVVIVVIGSHVVRVDELAVTWSQMWHCCVIIIQKVGSAGSQVCSHLIRGLCTMDLVPGFDACTSANCRGLLCTPPSYLILVTHVIRTSIPPVTHASYLQCTSSVLHLTPTWYLKPIWYLAPTWYLTPTHLRPCTYLIPC